MVSVRAVFLIIFVPALICGFFAVAANSLFCENSGGSSLRAAVIAPVENATSGQPDVAADVAAVQPVLVQDRSAAREMVSAVKNGTSIQLQLDVAEAQSVLFYAEGGFIAAPLYLGRGLPGDDGAWEYEFDTSRNALPNGEYKVYAQVYAAGDVYNTSGASIFVSVPVVWTNGATLDEILNKSDTEVNRISSAIEESIKTASGSVLPISDASAADIRSFADAVRAVEQLNRLREDKNARFLIIDSEIRSFEDEIIELRADILPIIKNDKLKRLADFRGQRSVLGGEAADIVARIEEKTKEKYALSSAILASAKSVENEPAIKKVLENLDQEMSRLEREIIASQDILRQDDDNDGLNNILEIKTGTDLFNPDTDGDGALDGDEAANNYNPLDADVFLREVYADPRKVNPRLSDIYGVNKAYATELSSGVPGIGFEGYGLPNSYIELYVYSVPIVAMVKVNDAGRWSYVLDYPLSDGRHAAYAARVNSIGQIEARSESLSFLKKGNDIVMIDYVVQAPATESIQKLKDDYRSLMATVISIAFFAALLVIGFINRRGQEAKY